MLNTFHTGTLANSEDPDDNAAFHNDMHCLQRYDRRLWLDCRFLQARLIIRWSSNLAAISTKYQVPIHLILFQES